MIGTILKSRISPPLLPQGLLSRRKLEAAMDYRLRSASGFTRAFTLIAAPAGYGKTTQARAWLSGRKEPVAWLSLAPENCLRQRFWLDVIAALQRQVESIGQSSQAVLTHDGHWADSPRDSWLLWLLNDLYDLPRPLFLVLDDYHLMDQPAIHTDMIYFIENLPPTVHLVLTTRSRPPFPLAKWRAQNQVFELTQNHLALSAQESFDFFRKTRNIDLIDDHIRKLHERCEGWLTGLNLAAYALAQNPDADHFVTAFAASTRHVFHYLSQEIFQNQKEMIQDFLLQISVLPRLSAALCQVVTGRADSEAILSFLETQHLFIMPVGDERLWFRFHPLFVDFLRHHLQLRFPDQEALLHEKAAHWFIKQEEYGQAIWHLSRGGHLDTLAKLLDAQITTVLQTEGHSVFFECLHQIGEQRLNQYPCLLLYKAWLTLIYQGKGQIREVLQNIESKVANQSPLCGILAVIRSYLAVYDQNMAEAIRQAKRAYDLLPEDSAFWRTSMAVMLGDARLFSGKPRKAQIFYEQAYRENLSQSNAFLSLSSGFKFATSLHFAGELNSAADLTQQLLQRARQESLHQISRVGLILTLHAEILREQGQLQEALTCLRRGLHLSENEKPGLAWNLLFAAALHRSRGKFREGLDAIETIARIRRESELPRFILSPALAWEIRLHLALEDFEAAAAVWRQSGMDLAQKPEPGEATLYLAGLQLAQENNPERVLNSGKVQLHLQDLAATAEKESHLPNLLFAGSRKIHLSLAQGKERGAAETLLALLPPVLRAGWSQSLLDEKKYLAPAASLALRLTQDEAMRSMLRQLSSQEEKTPTSAQWPQWMEPLSAREKEILDLICRGDSNPAIAAKLFLSPGTVKWYTSNIYSKLGVKNRTEAALMAQKMKID